MTIFIKFFLFFLFVNFQIIFADENIENNFNKKETKSIFANVLIETFGEEHEVNAFYLKNNYNFFWVNNEKKLLKLINSIKKSANHGLSPNRYDFNFLNKNYKTQTALIEIKAMKSFILLCEDLYSGLINPESLSKNINVIKKELDLKTLFNNLESQISIDKIIFDLAPKSLDYKNLINEYNTLKEIVKKNSWGDKVPEELVLGFQLKHKNVAILRTRLHKMGYISFDNKNDFYDAELRSAVQLFQSDFGLNDDGVAGFFTLQAINVPAYTRLIQVAVNIERAKWLSFEDKEKYVLVNQPNFRAKMYNKNEVTWESRVVIGLPDHQTAEFNNEISHLIINPTWHVPNSITLDEYLPLIKENKDFLKENDMILMVRGTKSIIDPDLIDMDVFEVDNFPFLIKQKPSNVNPLGVVKFMFPNSFNIYMHDTPMKELFFKDQRMFSHGCVRLQDPFEFAYTILSEQEEFPKKKFEYLLNSKKEVRVNLKENIPVYLIYRTVFFDDYNQTQFRQDIYGRDALIFMKLLDAGLEIDL